MARKPKLANIRVLIADGDVNIALVLLTMLQRMGFKHVHVVRNGAAAIELLQRERVDIVLTEWQMEPVDGLELTHHIRTSEDPGLRLMPVIMVTARAEKQDVEICRDAGVTEFVVKPFNSVTVFKRIKQIVDNPRGFLLHNSYTGPDRRRKYGQEEPERNRRKLTPTIISTEISRPVDDIPKYIPPDSVLKDRIGLTDSLDSIITPMILDKAQKVIDNLKDQSLDWIRTSIEKADVCYMKLVARSQQECIDQFGEAVLSIKSHSGTFGYAIPCEVAQSLYSFLRFSYTMGSSQHNQVLLKHLQALKVLLGHHAQGHPLEKEQQLLAVLQEMAKKFRPPAHS
jgi:two-component system, chemotaxis family, chemotaxis protein CheY